MAGGSELLLLIRDRKIPVPKYVVALEPLKKDLSYVKVEDDTVKIGALTTLWGLHNSILGRDKRFAGFEDVFHGFATMAMRFYATLGGNLVSATQYNDYITLLLVYDAKLKLQSVNGVRELSLEEFLIDKRKVDLRPNELITEISFKLPPENSSSSFIKFDRRRILIAGVVTGAAYLELEGNTIKDVRVSFDMVRDKRIPARARKTEEFLKGKELSEEILEEAAEKVLPTEMVRITDWWTTAEYRMDMSKVVLKRNILKAAERIREG